MSYPTRSLSSHMRAPSSSTSSASPSPALLARIEEKKAELQSLRELRDLSAAVSNQMEALEQKLTTLSDGTEGMAHSLYRPLMDRTTFANFCAAVAAVMGNWHNVLRAINMASSTFKNKHGSSTFANHVFLFRSKTRKTIERHYHGGCICIQRITSPNSRANTN